MEKLIDFLEANIMALSLCQKIELEDVGTDIDFLFLALSKSWLLLINIWLKRTAKWAIILSMPKCQHFQV